MPALAPCRHGHGDVAPGGAVPIARPAGGTRKCGGTEKQGAWEALPSTNDVETQSSEGIHCGFTLQSVQSLRTLLPLSGGEAN